MAFCISCGTSLSEDEKFCSVCGTPVDPATETTEIAPVQSKTENIKAFAGDVFGKVKDVSVDVAGKVKDVSVDVAGKVKDVSSDVAGSVMNNGIDKGVEKIKEKTTGAVKKFFLKNFIIPVVVAFVVCIGAAVILGGNKATSGGKYDTVRHFISYVSGDGEAKLTLDGKKEAKVEGNISSPQKSYNGKVMAFIATEDGGDYSDGATLYIYNGKLKKIADDVFRFQLANNGKSIAYTTDYEDGSYSLNLWNGGKSKSISKSLGGEFCISPNGKTVGYTEYDDGDYESFVWKNKAKSLGKDTKIIAVSDNYRYVYYQKNNNTYVQKGLKSDKKVKLGDGINTLNFNKSMSECFYNDGSKAKIIAKAKEVKPLKDNGNIINIRYGATAAIGNNIRYSVSSFKNCFYSDGDTIYRITSKFEAEKIAKGEIPQLRKDGKTIFFVKGSGNNGKIYKINGRKSGAEPKLIVSDDNEPVTFTVTDDGHGIYFINSDSEVFYQRGKGKAKQLGESDRNTLYTLYKGNRLYWVEDNELRTSKSGGKAKNVGNFEGDILYAYADPKGVYVYSNDKNTSYIYFSKNGKKFDLISETDS
ncbi:hypothetical protein FACS1894132_05140 [Clostridia bacterium]|nr:hypothetical protein FACS1894132_05140 [Clostridia bacterium]